jgi:HlyD family secretion protein
VQHISADAQEQSDEPGTAQPYHGAAYRALIALDADHLARDGNKLRLRPGMLVSAEIHLGTRSVIEYLLSPVQKIAHEAGRER